MQRMYSHQNNNNNDQLLIKWVEQQIAYYIKTGQLVNSLFMRDNNNYNNNNRIIQWRDIISNGFVLKLFQSIDDKRFSRLLSYEARNYHQLQIKQVVNSYWLALDEYLRQAYNKEINQYFMNEQTASRGRQYLWYNKVYNTNECQQQQQQQQQSYSLSSLSSFSSDQSMSIIQLVKVLFYLLVQKENTTDGNNDSKQLEQQQQLQQTNQEIKTTSNTCTQSTSSQQNIQSSNTNSQQQVNRNSDIEQSQKLTESILMENDGHLQQSNNNINDVKDDYYSDDCDNNNGQLIINKSKFLARICSLQQQVQQYLVNVIQTIQQKQIIKSIQQTKQTYHYQQQPSHHKYQTILQNIQQQLLTIPTTNSNQFRRIIFKQIQHLSQQNDQLRQKIYLLAQQNQSIQKEIQQNTQQQNTMLNKINQYNLQKQQLFTYLHVQNEINITSLEQFVQIVKHIEQQNQLLQNTISEIEQRNYQLQQSNAVKKHSINKNAVEITKVNQQIKKFKTKIKGLKEDIQYLDEIVNSQIIQDDNNQNDYLVVNNSPQKQQYQYLNAQMINSINVENQSQLLFRKSVDSQLRYSLGNVLRENRDIYNQKVFNPISQNLSEKRTLTRRSNNPRMSLQNRQKSLRKKNTSNYKVYLQNQQNIQPSPFDEEDYIHSDTYNQTFKQSSRLQVSQQQQQDQREIECEKQKYRQQLVTSLQQLYKQIADLSGQIASIKQSNKEYQKRSKFNEKKLTQLKSLHQAFLYEAFN